MISYRKLDSKHSIFNAKRFIGRFHDDPYAVADADLFDFKVMPSPAGTRKYKEVVERGYFDSNAQKPEAWFALNQRGHPKLISPVLVGAEVVKRLTSMVSNHLGHAQVKGAVIAVPAKFNVVQRKVNKTGRFPHKNIFVHRPPSLPLRTLGLQ